MFFTFSSTLVLTFSIVVIFTLSIVWIAYMAQIIAFRVQQSDNNSMCDGVTKA